MGSASIGADGGVSPPRPPDVIADYSNFDYRAQWVGREHVNRAEHELLRDLLDRADPRRIIEIGTGFGRLTGQLADRAEEYVALDFDPESLSGALQVARKVRRGRSPGVGALANLLYLPLARSAATTAVVVRVWHHLPDTVPALSGLATALLGGGTLILSYARVPSVGSLAIDLGTALHPPADGTRFAPTTFAREGERVDRPNAFPTFVRRRAPTREALRHAGFLITEERSMGMEEYFPNVPTALWPSLSRVVPSALGFPHLFTVAKEHGSPRALPALRDIWECPVCTRPLGWDPHETPAPEPCSGCGRTFPLVGGLADLRYVREGAELSRPRGPVLPRATGTSPR